MVSSIGGHGGGTPDELYVPIFLWGSGLSGSIDESLIPESSLVYGFPVVTDQINLCTLVASLLGTVVPTNAHGILPDHLLNASTAVKARLAATNVEHLHNLVNVRQSCFNLFT